MIDFPAFVQGLFLLLVIVLMITVIVFFRKPATRKTLKQDKRALFLLMTLGVIFVTSLLIGVKLSNWKAGYRHAKAEFQFKRELDLDEYRFTDQSFKPLGKEYRQLRASRDGLDKMIAKISQLNDQHENHKPLLEGMLKTFQDEKTRQEMLYKQVNIEIRHAMLLSATTQDAESVNNQFYNRAKELHAKIVAAQLGVQKKLGDAAGLLEDSLKEARLLLKKSEQYTVRNKRKKNSSNKKQRIQLYHFPDSTAHILLGHLEKYDAKMMVATKKIIREIITARQNKDTMSVLSQRETKLEIPLKKTMQLWFDAEIQGQQYWGSILYSLEAAYLADRFNMPHHNRAYRSLMSDLKVFIPQQLDKLVQTNKEVKSSFIAPDFVENTKSQ